MSLVDPAGKPLASDTAKEEALKRAQGIFEAVKAVLDEQKVSPAELMDLNANIFSLWCSICPASMFEANGNGLMNAFIQTLQAYAPLKIGELKLRMSIAANNPGTELTKQ